MATRRNKKERDQLTTEEIVTRAIELLDADGIEGLSMRRLGDALGVEAMAVYHYFPNKDALLDAVLATIIAQTGPAELSAGEDWKEQMMSGPAAAGRALEAHPKAGWLFLGRQYSTASSLQMLEVPLTILYGAGFRGQALVDAAHAIFAYAAGWYVLTSGQGGSWSGPAEESIEASGSIAPLATSLAPELRDWSRGFEVGMMALLEGLEAKLPR